MISLHELEEFIERRLPFGLQESWDNSGVWFRNNESINRIGVSLELAELSGTDVDTAIVHHPPALSSDEALRIVEVLKAGRNLNLIVCHTNADTARDSFVDEIAQLAGIENTKPLVPGKLLKLKVVTFIDEGNRNRLIEKINREGISSIGFYDSCTFSAPGKGTFKPVDQAQPYIGSRTGEIEEVEEWRVEFETTEKNVERVIEAVMKVHPYDEPVIEVYSFHRYPKGTGTGRTGSFNGSLAEFYERIKALFPSAVLLNDAGKPVSPVCIVPGGGRKLLPVAILKGVRTFVSGDLDYHTLLAAKEKGINVIGVEHGEAEKYFTGWMKKILQQRFGDKIEILIPGE